MLYTISKWNFMMDWCKYNKFPPGNSYFWKLAEKAWEEHQRNNRRDHEN